MTTDVADLRVLLLNAHGLMGPDSARSGPRPLGRFLDLAVQAYRGSSDANLAVEVRNEMLSADPNNPVRGLFAQMLRSWDFTGPANWTEGTEANSSDRRDLVYRLLNLESTEINLARLLIPFSDLRNANIVIAENHEEWYVDGRRAPGFYWKAYQRHLRRSGWPSDSLADLDEASNLIIERLSDPTRKEAWQTKGLVIGYVQSGKTANFTAVVAKAADAGYRLIVVLAGTLDVLRAQTQRRIDKELIGKELIYAGVREGVVHEYSADRDWQQFVEHTARPSQLGHFDFERLTGFQDDYRSLRRGIGALEFKTPYEDRPLNHRDNLRSSPVRIVVMKKHPSRIQALRKDLQRLRHTVLGEIPTLIIDDESDQASINTTRPPRAGEERKRTTTNREIVELLRCLPRAQYVGYTATPFANVFVDPSDAMDLFPKDFLVGLKRPAGYMGVRDFFDFDEDGRPLEADDRPSGFNSNERAFLRDVRAEPGEDEDDKDARHLPQAIDAFVLSGALKLYRAANNIPVNLRHHTMLVHRSTAQSEHARDRDLVMQVYDDASYGTTAANSRLKTLWMSDFMPVCEARAKELPSPKDFEELSPFIADALSRIQLLHSSTAHVRVVNAEPGMREQAPDFDRENVWSILVGGAKLSRGFTIEGLTISYFRRRVRTADTLMQTGRWFGFRRGYHDLVRVYFGRDEPDGKDRKFDLLDAFKAICQDEELFRSQLVRYMRRIPGVPAITPKQVPPLVAKHLLQPTAKNKMYNAVIRSRNFGEDWSEQTRLPIIAKKLADNAALIRSLLQKHTIKLKQLGATDAVQKSQTSWPAFVAELEPKEVSDLLDNFAWGNDADGLSLEREFLKGTGERDPQISRWVLIAPQLKTACRSWSCEKHFTVVERSRVVDRSRFKAFSEPRHRVVALAIAGSKSISIKWASDDTLALKGDETAVLLLYPAVEPDPSPAKKSEVISDEEVSLGLALYFPKNNIKEPLLFTVMDKSRPDDVVVSAP